MTRLACLLLVVFPAVAGADRELTKGTTWDCKTDPIVTIGNARGKYKFTGACKTISIGGDLNQLDIEAVDTLEIAGSSNKVNVGTIDWIELGGARNLVRWKTAKTGDRPTIRDRSSDPKGNDVARAK